MGRWAPGAQGRLEEAAMELFEERGFEDTTVADIAERAGLTKRTFFRYFGDKREVLFSGTEPLQAKFVEAIAAAPAGATPLDAANPDLQERELIKMIGFSTAGAAALRDRGVAEPAASLAAEAGIAVLRIAFEQWATGPKGQDIHKLLRDSLAELKAVAA
jgi:AcrR family transcriptional regulator